MFHLGYLFVFWESDLRFVGIEVEEGCDGSSWSLSNLVACHYLRVSLLYEVLNSGLDVITAIDRNAIRKVLIDPYSSDI